MSAGTNPLAWSLIEPHWSPLNASWDGGAADFLAHMHRVPPKVGHLYSGNWCVSEVDNGGFLQFFWNATGILAPEAAGCFKDMGAPALCIIVQDAMEYFGPIYPRDREARLIALGGKDFIYPKDRSELDLPRDRVWTRRCESQA